MEQLNLRYWVWFNKYCDEQYEGGLYDIYYASDDFDKCIEYVNRLEKKQHETNIFDSVDRVMVEVGELPADVKSARIWKEMTDRWQTEQKEMMEKLMKNKVSGID